MIGPLPIDKEELDIVQMHRCKLVLGSWKGFFGGFVDYKEKSNTPYNNVTKF
jgi:hypothetical protein